MVVAYVSCRIRKLASERGKKAANRLGGGWRCLENRKKILNSGNEPKNLFKTKELAIPGPKNEPVFEDKTGETNRRIGAENRQTGN